MADPGRIKKSAGRILWAGDRRIRKCDCCDAPPPPPDECCDIHETHCVGQSENIQVTVRAVGNVKSRIRGEPDPIYAEFSYDQQFQFTLKKGDGFGGNPCQWARIGALESQVFVIDDPWDPENWELVYMVVVNWWPDLTVFSAIPGVSSCEVGGSGCCNPEEPFEAPSWWRTAVQVRVAPREKATGLMGWPSFLAGQSMVQATNGAPFSGNAVELRTIVNGVTYTCNASAVGGQGGSPCINRFSASGAAKSEGGGTPPQFLIDEFETLLEFEGGPIVPCPTDDSAGLGDPPPIGDGL